MQIVEKVSNNPQIKVCLLVPYSLSSSHGNAIRVKQMIQNNRQTTFSVFSYDLPWVKPKTASIPFSLTLQAAYMRLIRKLPVTDFLVCEKTPKGLVERFSNSNRNAQITQVENLWAIPIALKARREQQPLMATLHDVYSDRIRELLKHFGATPLMVEKIARRVHRIEEEVIPQLDACVLVSQEDLKRYAELGVHPKKAAVIPNGVDTHKFKPIPHREKYRLKYGLKDCPSILFAGSDMYQNRETIGVIANTLKEIRGKYQLVVAGSISRYAHNHLRPTGVPTLALGYVEALDEVYAAVDLVFAPMVSGTGTKLKILEAMACAKPVLTTLRGVRGLDVGGACVAVEDTSELPARLEELLSDSSLREELGRRACDAAQKYDWNKLMPLYREIYSSLLQA